MPNGENDGYCDTTPLSPVANCTARNAAFRLSGISSNRLTAPSVNEEVLYAAVAAYLLIAVAWSFLFRLLSHFDPNAFAFTVPEATGNEMQGFTAMYYSVGSLSSVSFGDIMPVSNAARMLVLLEAVVGLFYMTIMIARLVSLYTSEKTS